MAKAGGMHLQLPTYINEQSSEARREFLISLATDHSTRQTIQELSKNKRHVTSSTVSKTRQIPREMSQNKRSGRSKEQSSSLTGDVLQDITYGVEVERYNLNISLDERARVINDIRSLSKQEQKQKIKEHLKVELTPQSMPTSAFCFIRNAKSELIMEVRLDGEREIATSKQGKEHLIHKSCFNMEFISVDAGIKKSKDFFEDVSQGNGSEINNVVTSFEKALSNAIFDDLNPIVNGYRYQFTPLAQKYLLAHNLGARVKHDGEAQSLERETAFHITHSIPLTDMNRINDPENHKYIAQLGIAFNIGKDEGEKTRVAQNSATPRTAAKTVFVEAPHLPTQSFTRDRNESQPLLKEPLEYLVVFDGHNLQRSYLQSAEDGNVLQPTSNLVEYVKYDLEVYRELVDELEAKRNEQRERKQIDPEKQENLLALLESSTLEKERAVLNKGITKLNDTIYRLTELHDQALTYIFPVAVT